MIRCATICRTLLAATALSLSSFSLPADETDSQATLKLEHLLRTSLEVAEGLEVIVSRVSVPPHSELPKHWHPGEEFGYLLEGKVSLWLEGKVVSTSLPGEAVKIPLGKVHTAITGEEGAELLVFRVHPEGEPERVLVD